MSLKVHRSIPACRLFAALATVGLALTGCTTTYDASPAHRGYDTAAASAFVGSTDSSEPRQASATTVDKSIIVSGSLVLDLSDPKSALEDATKIVEDAQGSVEQSALTFTDGKPTASARLMIPAASFEQVRDAIADLGSVAEQSTQSNDVGADIVDLDAQINALIASISRLEALRDQAQTTADLIEAERELTDRNAQLDGLRAQREWYGQQVDYSTLELTLRSTSRAPSASTPLWERSWQTFVDGLTFIGYALVMLAPWLLLLAILAALSVVIVRKVKKQRMHQRAHDGENTVETHGVPDASDTPASNGEGSFE